MMKKLLVILIFLLGNQFMNSQSALDFNQSDGVVLLNTVIPLPVSYTLEARFKSPLPTITYNTLFRGSNYNHPILTKNNILGAYDNFGGTDFNSSGFDMATLSAGWHHIAAVCNGGSTIFYVDGVNVGSIAFQSSDNIYSIGNIQTGGQNFGVIDEVAIWSLARSSTDIQNGLNGCLVGNETGLVAFYNFEDGAGSSMLTDITGNVNGYGGTLTSMDITNDWVNGFDCSTLSTDSFETNSIFTIYSDPSSSTLNVRTDFDASFTVFNQLGQIVHSFDVDANVEKRINVENLTQGIYIVRGNGGNNIITKKILIK